MMRMKSSIALIALGASSLLGTVGCQGQTSDEPQIVPIRNMYHQPRYNVQSESELKRVRRTLLPRVETQFGPCKLPP